MSKSALAIAMTETSESVAGRLENIAAQIEDIQLGAFFQIGAKLSEAKALLAYERAENGFGGWVERRLSISIDKANRLIDAYRHFGKVPQIAELSRSVIWELVKPSTPESVREEAVRRVEAGATMTLDEVKELRAQGQEAEKTSAQLAADNEGLGRQVRMLSRELTSARASLEQVEKPQVILVGPDVATQERQYEAFVTHFRSLPMDLRERFFSDFPNWHCSPSKQEPPIDAAAEDDTAGLTAGDGRHQRIDQELSQEPAAPDRDRGIGRESIGVDRRLRLQAKTPVPADVSAASPDAATTAPINRNGLSQEEWDALEIPAPFRR